MVTQVCYSLGQPLQLCDYLRQTLALLLVLDVLVMKALQLSYALALLWKVVTRHMSIAVAFSLQLRMAGYKKMLGSFSVP